MSTALARSRHKNATRKPKLRETLDVVCFHLYLDGTEFGVYTDHKALEVIYSPKAKLGSSDAGGSSPQGHLHTRPNESSRLVNFALCISQSPGRPGGRPLGEADDMDIQCVLILALRD